MRYFKGLLSMQGHPEINKKFNNSKEIIDFELKSVAWTL